MSFVYCLYMTGPYIFDYIKRLIHLTVIPLSGGHCILILRVALLSGLLFFLILYYLSIYYTIPSSIRFLVHEQEIEDK
jgi:hypothetical protein